MSDDDATSAGVLLRELLDAARDESRAREDLHLALQRGGLLSRVTLHRYMCASRGCQLATVFAAGGSVLCAVRDYKPSHGLNERLSVPSARTRNTLDGERHWPSAVYEVSDLATWGQDAGFDVICNHVRVTLRAGDVLELVAGVIPGRPGKPTRLR